MSSNQPRALLSVSDKTGIGHFARALESRGFQIVSTGGTARILREAGISVTEVADITGHPEIMEGRVKTLHPAIHGPLLARRDVPADLDALAEHGYRPIDIVAVNLYPFRETVEQGGVTLAEAMEKVDIGGPTMLRAAAKNHAHLWVVVDPADYPRVLDALDRESADPSPPGTTEHAASAGTLRRELAARVFTHVSSYDAAVASWLIDGTGDLDPLPSLLARPMALQDRLRYGENPDQAAALYIPADGPARGVAALIQRQGKALSYNNLLDVDGALLALSPFVDASRPAAVIVKHTTPCGIAVGDTLEEAFRGALASDPVSAFGSIIAFNRPLDEAAAQAVTELFVECVVAPGFDHAALEILAAKPNLRVLETGPVDGGHHPEPRLLRTIEGGLLAQTPAHPPRYQGEDPEWRVVTRRTPTGAERDDLAFAWASVFSVKSNAILLARDGATIGIGAGQMSRVDSARLAVYKAGEAGHTLDGSVLASDAFFPFRDGVDAAAAAGIRAIIQPGGSVRDDEVIAAADEHDLAMIFTGRRLFRH